MTNASRDENNVPTILGVLSTDGETLIPIVVESTDHSLGVNDDTTGSDLGPTNAPRDENFVPVLMGVSSVDGITPVVVYADINGNLLVNSQ